jgi:hypothetical protein
MEQMVKGRVHTFIWDSEETYIEAKVNADTFDWNTFWYFYEISLEHAIAVMPQILSVLDLHYIEEE